MRWVVLAATATKDKVRVATFSRREFATDFIESSKNHGIHGGYIFKPHTLLGECVHAWVEEEEEIPHDPLCV